MATPQMKMTSATAAARVNVRDVLRVSAVESYTRNFQGESHRLQELLEITLCYGIYCVSRNFQLKGMTVDELRTITNHKEIKTHDFYVRNGINKQRRTELAEDPHQLFNKPAHSWRDGELKPEILPVHTSRTLSTEATDANVPEVFFLPTDAHKDKLDEIDFYTKLLGKSLVDIAWTTYSARGASLLNQQQLEERMTRVDQRKRPDLIPQTELPVCSFVEFLHAYTRSSLAQSTTTMMVPQSADQDETEHATKASSFERPTARRPLHSPSTSTAPMVAASRPNQQQKPHTPPARRDPPPPRSKSLQNVQSKIQPELRAHREKLLRVKKTQAQLMRESLARTRLAEYAARQGDGGLVDLEGAPARRRPLGVKRMPLDKITPGAAALEIVDDFMQSPLMDTFGGDPSEFAGQRLSRATRSDPLKEELYGTAAHDDSFLGCKTPSAKVRNVVSPEPPSKKTTTRDYSGWLGDFGPQHTKTVRPVWATDVIEVGSYASHEANSRSSDEENHPQPHRRSRRQSVRADRFEWKFDLLATPRDNIKETRSSTKDYKGGSLISHAISDEEEDEEENDARSESDNWSIPRSEASDPVYRWLKTVTP